MEGEGGAIPSIADATASAFSDPSEFDRLAGLQPGEEIVHSDDNEAASGNAPTQQGQPPAQAGAQGQGEGNVFYDASKVPAELQASFKQMQAAWTRKTQALGSAMPIIEQLGGIESVAPLLQALTTQEGQREIVAALSEQLGVEPEYGQQTEYGDSRDYAQGAPYGPEDMGQFGEEAGYPPQDPNTPPPWFQEYLQQQQEAAENSKLEDAFNKLGISDPVERNFVGEFAARLPVYLGYENRLRQGQEAYQKMLDGKVAELMAAKQQVNAKAPGGPLGGGTPANAGPEAPKDFAGANAAMKAYLNSQASAQ